LIGNLPSPGDHIAWAESSAVCYANSVLGARTNREGGPSALAAALTGVTPAYGYHLDENRKPGVTIEVRARLEGTHLYGALGLAAGRRIERERKKPVPYFTGLEAPGIENMKSLCASLATYGGAAIFHIQGVTPEAGQHDPPPERWVIEQDDIDRAISELDMTVSEEVDFVSLGCPHLTIEEVGRIALLLNGKRVTKTFWITTSRPVKLLADQRGYSQIITDAGATFAVDTCCVVAPIAGRFHALATDSAKACYYASSKNHFKTRFLPFEDVVREALK
jgi:predicted aconitase